MPSHQARRSPLPPDYQFPTNCACPSCKGLLTPEEPWRGFNRAVDEAFDALLVKHCCPKCQGPSYRGGLCVNCTSVAEPTHDTPWGV